MCAFSHEVLPWWRAHGLTFMRAVQERRPLVGSHRHAHGARLFVCVLRCHNHLWVCVWGSSVPPVPRRASRLRCFACKLRGADVPCAVIRADMGVQRPIHMARVHLRRVFGAWSRCIFSVAWLDLARPGRHELLPSAIRRSVGACGVETRHQLQGHRVRDRSGMPVCCVALCS